MTTTHQEVKERFSADFEAGKKAFTEAMAKAQTHIDETAADLKKLRANLKTQATEAKAKALAQIDELTKKLDSARADQQAKIETRLKELHTQIESSKTDLKHATATEKHPERWLHQVETRGHGLIVDDLLTADEERATEL